LKPYLRGAGFLLLILLAGCISTPTDPADRKDGRVESVSVVSKDSDGTAVRAEASAGDGTGISPDQSAPPLSGLPSDSSWPSAPPPAEMPRPEEAPANEPEPLAVALHIIQADSPDFKAALETEASEESAVPEEAPPVIPEISFAAPAAVPEAAEPAGGGVIAPGADRTGSTRINREEPVKTAPDPPKPEETSLTLPGWNSVETRVEQVFTVSPRDPHLLILEGTGWTLKSGQGIHTNLERSLQPGMTVFTFLVPREGSGELVFQRQDLTDRVLYLKTVIYRGENPPEAGTEKSEVVEGLSEIPTGEKENPAGERAVADVGASPPVAEGLDRTGGGARETAPLSEESSVDTDTLFNAAVQLYNSQDYHALARVLGQLQSRDLSFWEQDRLLLFLGRLHDLGSPLRDEKAALGYYTRLVEEYPGSLYWEEANRRARYIRRHFFQIR